MATNKFCGDAAAEIFMCTNHAAVVLKDRENEKSHLPLIIFLQPALACLLIIF